MKMPWTYHQRTGILERENTKFTGAYAGKDAGKNNPDMQTVPDVGPLPRGSYRIGHPRHSTRVGHFAMPLTPLGGTNTFGRSAFYIHGDNPAHIGDSSFGCIVIGLRQRRAIWASGDHRVDVVR